MTDEIFWRKVLSMTFGDLVSVRTGITLLKTKLIKDLVSDDLNRGPQKTDLKKPWHQDAVKLLTILKKRTEKRSLGDAKESAAKRQAVIPDVDGDPESAAKQQAVIPDVDGDAAKNMAADTLIALHGS
jgi:hypothetical protein